MFCSKSTRVIWPNLDLGLLITRENFSGWLVWKACVVGAGVIINIGNDPYLFMKSLLAEVWLLWMFSKEAQFFDLHRQLWKPSVKEMQPTHGFHYTDIRVQRVLSHYSPSWSFKAILYEQGFSWAVRRKICWNSISSTCASGVAFPLYKTTLDNKRGLFLIKRK